MFIDAKHEELLDQCRLALGRLHHGMLPLRTVSADVRDRLIAGGLIFEPSSGYLDITSRGKGYAADPSLFDIEPAQSVEPITTAGWYPLDDGRWGFYAWVRGQPVLTQRAERPPTAEEQELEQELEQAAKARRAAAELARAY